MFELLRWSLRDCFVINGSVHRRQVKGIPLGISSSPQLANLLCYVAEQKFVYSSSATAAAVAPTTKTVVPQNLNCRYLDDVFVVDSE